MLVSIKKWMNITFKKMISMVNGITKYVHEKIKFVQINYAQILSSLSCMRCVKVAGLVESLKFFLYSVLSKSSVSSK
jgi:hypothetical protein